MKSIYSDAMLQALNNEGISIDQNTQLDHQRTLASMSSFTVEPLKKIYYFKDIGFLIPIKTVGKGHFGKVKKVVDNNGKFYALKKSTFPKTDKNIYYPFFLNEQKTLASLNRLHGSDSQYHKRDKDIEKQLTCYILTEFYDGPNAKTFITALTQEYKTIEMDQALRIFSSMAAELTSLHEAKIIHNDITPSNFIIVNNDEAKLVDFGASASGASHACDIYLLGKLFEKFIGVIFIGQTLNKFIFMNLINQMNSTDPSTRPPIFHVYHVLNLMRVIRNPSVVQTLHHIDFITLYTLAIHNTAPRSAIEIVNHLHNIDPSLLQANAHLILTLAMNFELWPVAAQLLTKNINPSLYSDWGIQAERFPTGDFLNTMFNKHFEDKYVMLRVYAIAVSQKIETLDMNTEKRNAICTALQDSSPSISAETFAKTILDAISTNGLKKRFFKDTAWAHIAENIQLMYPGINQRATSHRFTLFQRQTNPTPDQVPLLQAQGDALSPKLLHRNTNIK